MNHETRALYREVMDEIWIHGFITTSVEELANLTQTPLDVCVRCWPQIHDCLVPIKGNANKLTSERMEEERRKRNKIKKIRARWGKAGGEASGKSRRSKDEANASGLLKQNEPTQDKNKTSTSTTVVKSKLRRVPEYSERFQGFWDKSTRRGSKVDAWDEWEKIDPSEHDAVDLGMFDWMQSEQWQNETKQPHIHRWLERRGWEEVVPKTLYTPGRMAATPRFVG